MSRELAVTRVEAPTQTHGRLAPQLDGLIGSTMPRIDWCDAFWIELAPGSPEDPLYWRSKLFGQPTDGPIGRLMGVRDALAVRLGLKRAALSDGAAFPVLALDSNEVVLGMDDRHLDFRVALTIRPDGRDVMVVTTAVRLHNRLGRTYFALVKWFHLVLVPRWSRQAIRRGDTNAAPVH